MKNYIKELKSKFKKYEIDGYVIPKNDDYFTEYSKLNRLEVISNFSGSAGLAIILKNINYLFTDGRYTIQSKIESGNNFKIYGFEKLINFSTKKGLCNKKFKIETPLINLKKKDIIQIGFKNGVDFSMTSSCYDPSKEKICRRCDACLLRKKGFEEAGIEDPLWRE